MDNIRKYLDWNDAYFKIDREERNIAAILYHILLSKWPDNLNKFLQLIPGMSSIAMNDRGVGIYFEYSYLRDLWAQIDGADANGKKRELIYRCLKPENMVEMEGMSTLEFNTFFGAVPKASRKFIQSPGNWCIGRFKDNYKNSDNEQFLKVCMFKWSFNAKPDIVIHTSYDTAVCIEAKYVSGEGHYPTMPSEKREFKTRGIPFVRQTRLQKFMMRELLGINTQFVYLVNKLQSKPEGHIVLFWKDVFASLDTCSCPTFIQEWICGFDDSSHSYL